MSHARRLVTAAVTAVAAVALSVSTAVAIPSTAPSGVDVSGNNHASLRGIDWDAVKSDGQSYAFVKATEGVGFVNNHFVRDANAAAAAGLKVGAYHYARPAGDAKQQAASFASQIALVPTQTLPPVLDIEVDEGLSAGQLEEWIDTFMTEVKTLTGRTPMLYTYKYFWMGQMGNSTRFSEYPLWLAAYQDTAPDPVGGWDKLAFWQRSGSGRVAGIETDVDMNLFNGTEAQLQSFSGGNYIDFGGILDDMVIPGIDLGDDAGVLIAGILALAAGAVAVPAVADAAKNAGLDVDATGLIKQAEKLLNDGAISTDDLKDMANNDASIGDLAIFLDNAQHLQDVDADNVSQQDVENADRAARSAGHAAGVAVPNLDSKQVADLLNSLR
ncbi:glycoside hydrolase family 25 protein [Corynebacterium aurimucosum]|uniref:glycoside hydrolase family 25 protein n=1 Tax=Corynebacterium aurimucosum TaxID=169292 RepID=UPI00187A21AA|nr:glycoside hydrolase family 25 protein [Corynebacterium aurimucosum]MBE7364870.1 glycoside hydrolase family 25 protein [Corynebacterium aurimucosum]